MIWYYSCLLYLYHDYSSAQAVHANYMMQQIDTARNTRTFYEVRSTPSKYHAHADDNKWRAVQPRR